MLTITDHGQTVYIVYPHELDDLHKKVDSFTWFSKKLSQGNHTIWYDKIQFYKQYGGENFYLGYYFNKGVENDTPLIVDMYNSGNGFQRVQFENAACQSCKTVFFVANPTYFALYPNNDLDINELQYPLLNCPKCGGKLSRPAIWVKKRG